MTGTGPHGDPAACRAGACCQVQDRCQRGRPPPGLPAHGTAASHTFRCERDCRAAAARSSRSRVRCRACRLPARRPRVAQAVGTYRSVSKSTTGCCAHRDRRPGQPRHRLRATLRAWRARRTTAGRPARRRSIRRPASTAASRTERARTLRAFRPRVEQVSARDEVQGAAVGRAQAAAGAPHIRPWPQPERSRRVSGACPERQREAKQSCG